MRPQEIFNLRDQNFGVVNIVNIWIKHLCIYADLRFNLVPRRYPMLIKPYRVNCIDPKI